MSTSALPRLAAGAVALADCTGPADHWAQIDALLADLFGHRLFTVLLHLPEHGLMRRIHTNDESTSALGGFKRTGSGPWSDQVLGRGEFYVGRNADDIRTVFSEAPALIAKGLESVFNIPVRHQGEVIGSLNLLAGEGAYDAADRDVAEVVAAMCVPYLLKEAEGVDVGSIDKDGLESV